MAFSLSNWFKGKGTEPTSPEASETAPAPAPAPAPAAPPQVAHPSVRTVMPNSAQPVSLRDPSAPRGPVSLPVGTPPPPNTANLSRMSPVRPPARKISFPIPDAGISLANSAPRPAAVVPEPEPAQEAPDVMVNLEVGDFLDRLPPGFIKSGAVDRHQVIEFRASELYSDLSKGRASVPASTIYQKCPDIFVRPISDTEDVEVPLPLQKLVEQLSAALHTRTDQVAEENVAEIETPFLQVAMEDSARLPKAAGTVAGAVRPVAPLPVIEPEDSLDDLPRRPQHRTGQISTITQPRSPMEPPPTTAPLSPAATGPINPGKRPPSTVRASVAGGKIRLSGPAAVTRIAPAGPAAPAAPTGQPNTGAPARPSTASQRIQLPIQPTSPSHQVSKKTARIQIPPISLRSGGPGAAPRPGSVPPPPSVPVQPSPVSIRPATGNEPPVTFRSSPPPPPAGKLPPPKFSPHPRPIFPPPAFPAAPGLASTPAPMAPLPAAPAPADDRKIELGLAAVLRGLPGSALSVEASAIPDDVRFSLPFATVDKQLSQGRVVIGRQEFIQALPEGYQHVLADDDSLTEIPLPLQEVFQNLPTNAITIRTDQVVEEIGELYPTPFSQKADEDAQRFGTPAAQIPAPVEDVAEPAAVVEEPVAEPAFTPVNAEFTDAAPEPVVEEAAETLTDHPVPETENAAPATVDEPEIELAQDIPLDLPEDRATTPEETAPPVEVDRAEEPVSEVSEVPPVVAEEPAVEPPAATEPPPVEEALAVLESTAPGEPVVREEEPVAHEEPVVQEHTPVAHEAEPGAQFEEPAVEVEKPAAEVTTTLPALASDVEEVSVKADEPRPAAPAPSAATMVRTTDTELQKLFMTEDELDAKAIVRFVSQFPGVSKCAIMFADGLSLAGNFPDSSSIEGFCAMAPPFFKRTQNFVSEIKLGGLQAVTLYTEGDLLSFFMHDNICLSVRHSGRGFLPGVREKLELVTKEVAKMYSSKPNDSTDFSQ